MYEENIQQLKQSVKSIAIVGANYRFATQVMLNNLDKFNFKGQIFLVNPKYEEINGKKCFPSLIDIPGSIDVVIGIVNPQLMVKVAKEASNISAQILVIPGGGYGESGVEGKKIQDSILESALKTGMRIVGPNCMGYADLNLDFTPYIGTLDRPNRPLRKGSVSIVSQSGSILDSFIASNLKLNKLFSTGNEIDISMADYLTVLAEDESTSVIVLYIEAIRDHEKLLTALDLCKENEKPVIALKIGKTKKSTEIANAHSGALAGDYEIEKLFLQEHGVIFVDDIDKAISASKILSTERLPLKNTLAAITVSGGQAGHLIDLADTYNVELAEYSKNTSYILEKELPELAPLGNPLDIWGKSNKDFSEVSKLSLETLANDPNVGVLAVAIDAPIGQGDQEFSFTGTPAKQLAQIKKQTNKPLIYFNHIQNEFDPRVLSILEESGIPAIQGGVNALVACYALFQYKDHLDKEKETKIYSFNQNKHLEQSILLDDTLSREFLDKYNFRTPSEKVVNDLQEAIEFSESISYPVVLKAQGLAHKTDVGGVSLNLQNKNELIIAWNNMEHLNPPYYLIQEMISSGFETILSYKTDKHFGPVIIFGLGGVYTELLNKVVLAIPPISTQKAEEMIQSIPMLWKNVRGYRGKPQLDMAALIDAIIQMGIMAEREWEKISEFEINPLIVREKGKGVTALDVLASAREKESIGLIND